MRKKEMLRQLTAFMALSDENYIREDDAISKELTALGIYDPPLMGIAAANDPMFDKLCDDPNAVGPHHKKPTYWLKDAKSVVSIFLPFTMEIKKSNAIDCQKPSAEWLHGRIEGQSFLNEICKELKRIIESLGGDVVIPTLDERFWRVEEPDPFFPFTSNWSERHIGFVCGLGTFGISKGLITEAGMAGRLASLVTNVEIEPTERKYKGVYDYCTKCGACVSRCPVHAISLEAGKDHTVCGKYINYTKEKYAPRYGCGKCQTGVPCASFIPVKML